MPIAKKIVLVVEDNLAMNNALCEILELNGYVALSAANGVDALKILEKQRPDVILCDIMMPKMDGYGLLRQTRADEKLRVLPFIFLTARSSVQDVRQAKSIGIEDYLVKPVDPEDLIIAVENALGRVQRLARETQMQMDSLRNQIVRTLQHEFRTPLTFILGYAEYLAEVRDEPVDLDTLRLSTNAILEGGHRLQDLVEKFLMLADIQFRQQLSDQMEELSAHHVVLNAAETMNAKAQEVGVQLIVTEPAERGLIYGDFTYLHRALLHLIENSLQYRRSRSRYVWLSTCVRESYIGLQVRDESKGIPADLLHDLQRPFEQIDMDNRTTPGAGLSLALIQHIVRLHSGRLEVESTEGQGSAFTLWLPRHFADSEIMRMLEADGE